MNFLFHVDSEPAQCRIDGKTIIIPPNEVFEVPEIRGTDCNNNGPQEYIIPNRIVAEKIIAHCWYNGVVEVPVVKTKTGVNADVAGAKEKAKAALELAQDQMLTRYVNEQQERVTRENKPAIAPNGRVAKIIELRGIDLKKDFNIDPPGYVLDKIQDRDREMSDMKEQMAKLQKQLADMTKVAK